MARKPAVLDQLNLVVGDMEAAIDFYGRLGLSVSDTAPTWRAHHRTLDEGQPLDLDIDSAAFASRWNRGWAGGKTGVVIGFRVACREDVDALYQELTTAGYAGQQPPYDAFWGARYAVVEDPGGNAVGLMSPADPSRRTPPPEPPR